MGWSIKESARPGQYLLCDPSGNTAVHGTLEQVRQAMQSLGGVGIVAASLPDPVPAVPGVLASPKWPRLGDVIFVLYWHDNVLDNIDRGSWQTIYGTALFCDGDYLCYEPASVSLRQHWGRDIAMMSDNSTLRIVKREMAFPDEKTAMDHSKTLVPPTIVRR